MHYYSFNIADFNNSTRHLTRLERSIYRDLIDLYYDSEKPINLNIDIISRKIIITSHEEKKSLCVILDEFFDKTPNGFVKDRIERDLEKYRSKADSARANGKLGGRPKKPKITQSVNLENPAITQPKANQELITNNQELITNNQELITNNPSLKDTSVFDKIWNMYEKKGNKKTSLSRFQKLKNKDVEAMTEHIPNYVLSTPDKKYRKNFEVYINKEAWNDEIINNQPQVYSNTTVQNITNIQGWLDEQQ